jgi:Domain of unknown function DUF11
MPTVSGVSKYSSTTTVAIVNPHADLQVAESVDNLAPGEGELATFTVTATNHNEDNVFDSKPAVNVAIQETLSDGLSFFQARTLQGTYSAQTAIWSIPIPPDLSLLQRRTCNGRGPIKGRRWDVRSVCDTNRWRLPGC